MRYILLLLILIPVFSFAQKESLLITNSNDTIHCKSLEQKSDYTFYRTFESNLTDSLLNDEVKQIIGADLARELRRQKQKEKPQQKIVFVNETSDTTKVATSTIPVPYNSEIELLTERVNLGGYYLDKASRNIFTGWGLTVAGGVVLGLAASAAQKGNNEQATIGYVIGGGIMLAGFTEVVLGYVRIGKAGRAMQKNKSEITLNINHYGPTIGYRF